MKLTFEDIMNYHPENREVFEDLKRKLPMVVPFVGAGLSVPCGYPQWGKALEGMAKRIGDISKKENVAEIIKQKKYLEAADQLEKILGQNRLANLLLQTFNEEKIASAREHLPEQAVFLLPLLFPKSPAVTTNFDRVLETVYREHQVPFDYVVHPGHPELETKLTQGNIHGLFKIHGDVGKETLEYSSIVFAKRQYDQVYQSGSPLVTRLSQWFKNRILLFLGCSMDVDRTMELLGDVVQKNFGVTHFAILQKKNDVDAQLRELEDTLGVRAILYPPEEHIAVRIILEKLLEESRPDIYRSLSYHAGALPKAAHSNSFRCV